MIKINGSIISGSIGKNISISNGKIIVDGVDVTPDSKNISISIEGNVETVTVSACDKIEITGDVGSVKTQSGDVKIIGNVSDSVQTMSGDVECGIVSGNIKTMSGDINYKKIELK